MASSIQADLELAGFILLPTDEQTARLEKFADTYHHNLDNAQARTVAKALGEEVLFTEGARSGEDEFNPFYRSITRQAAAKMFSAIARAAQEIAAVDLPDIDKVVDLLSRDNDELVMRVVQDALVDMCHAMPRKEGEEVAVKMFESYDKASDQGKQRLAEIITCFANFGMQFGGEKAFMQQLALEAFSLKGNNNASRAAFKRLQCFLAAPDRASMFADEVLGIAVQSLRSIPATASFYAAALDDFSRMAQNVLETHGEHISPAVLDGVVDTVLGSRLRSVKEIGTKLLLTATQKKAGVFPSDDTLDCVLRSLIPGKTPHYKLAAAFVEARGAFELQGGAEEVSVTKVNILSTAFNALDLKGFSAEEDGAAEFLGAVSKVDAVLGADIWATARTLLDLRTKSALILFPLLNMECMPVGLLPEVARLQIRTSSPSISDLAGDLLRKFPDLAPYVPTAQNNDAVEKGPRAG